jgi:hypothetical protein
MSGRVELNVILRLNPQRLAALLRSKEREGNVHHAAHGAAALIGGSVRELDQRRHLAKPLRCPQFERREKERTTRIHPPENRDGASWDIPFSMVSLVMCNHFTATKVG